MTVVNNQQAYLNAMGIQTWQLKQNHAPAVMQAQSEEMQTQDNTWTSLEKQVAQCTKCQLCESRTQTVFGVGSQTADLLIIGEAPGYNEDKQGEPFVGRAGQLLNEMLKSIGLSRQQIYIANILKCRPPNNRDPLPEEVRTCTPYLKQQIQLLQPKLIVAVGRIAAQFLLNTQTSLGRLRGQTHHYENIPLLITYHPAYLLRSPGMKSKAYQDLLMVKSYFDKPN